MMEQPSFLSRFVEPVVGFFKTVPSTIREGFTEVADAISPARKRRRSSDSSTYQPPLQPHISPLPRASPEKSFHPQPKRLRLSDASASNAAGPSVTTPAAFRPAQDLLAAATSPVRPNPQVVMRDAYPTNENHFSDLNPARRFSTPAPRLTSDLDIQSFFHYPFPGRRSSLTGLRGIWPSNRDSSESHRRSLITFNPQLNTAQLYWQRVEERHRAQAEVTSPFEKKTSPFRSAEKHDPSLSRHPAPQFEIPTRDSVLQRSYSLGDGQPRSFSRTTKFTPIHIKMQPRAGMKKKRFYSEQRVRRSHQASVKKLAATATSLQYLHLANKQDSRDQPPRTANMSGTNNNVPMPFVEIMEKDPILGQKLMKMHGAAMTRLVKSQNRSRHRQLECWLAEQDLKQIQRKREEARRLNAIESKVWKRAEDPSQPPNDEAFVDVDYWHEKDPGWKEELDEAALAEREQQITVPKAKNAFAPLSQSAVRRLQVAFNDHSNHYKDLAKIHGCVIRGEDLRRLKPNCWLNDEIVNAYMALLTARTERLRDSLVQSSSSRDSVVPNTKIMNSFFYSKLVQFNKALGRYEYNYSRVRRWTRRFDVFSFDIMLIPINEQNVHWTLGVIDFRNCRVEHLDSMGTGGSASVREFLMRWVQDEAEDKEKRLDPSKWKAVERRVPIQENTDDCGVFLCKYADFICRGWKKFTFSQRHMNYFRARIAHELLMERA